MTQNNHALHGGKLSSNRTAAERAAERKAKYDAEHGLPVSHYPQTPFLSPQSEAEAVARICHEANRAYCTIIGDFSHKPWDETSENIRQSAIAGVEYLAERPDATPEDSHENWLRYKSAEGWVYGEVKDLEKKTHPCMVPYSELPENRKRQDALFRNIVFAFTGTPVNVADVRRLLVEEMQRADAQVSTGGITHTVENETAAAVAGEDSAPDVEGEMPPVDPEFQGNHTVETVTDDPGAGEPTSVDNDYDTFNEKVEG